MTQKSDFNAEEWSTLVEAPVLAGLRVVTAGRGGTIKESIAMGKVYAQARQQHGDSELLDQLVASPPAMDPSRLASGAGDVAQTSTTRLQEAVRVLDQKGTPQDVEAYKRFVLGLAQTVAEAHSEGGFAGIGGKPVSDEERAALDELAATLQLPAS
jgi:hypothetical protein